MAFCIGEFFSGTVKLHYLFIELSFFLGCCYTLYCYLEEAKGMNKTILVSKCVKLCIKDVNNNFWISHN